jgi:carbon storage regulator
VPLPALLAIYGELLKGERSVPRCCFPAQFGKEFAVLVLSRRLNEAIVLPGLGVTIKVAAIKGGCVRIGIEAPRHVRVIREELMGQSLVPRQSPSAGS